MRIIILLISFLNMGIVFVNKYFECAENERWYAFIYFKVSLKESVDTE